jgi:prephenate dehydratase
MHPELTVVGEQQVRVVHNLIAHPGADISDIKKVYSHPQALAQCREFLEKVLPNAEAIPSYDTAGSVEFVKNMNDKSAAAIAGSPAAKYYGMEILRQGIETNPSNYTRFYILSREENAEYFRSQSKPNKVALSFSVSDEPGSLMRVLSIFGSYGLNMTKLESRPIPGKPWEYTFFVEVQIKEDDALSKAVEEIKAVAASFRVLGQYTSVL